MLKTQGGETTSQKHGKTLHDRTPVQSPATTDLVQSEDADKSSELRGRQYRVGVDGHSRLTI